MAESARPRPIQADGMLHGVAVAIRRNDGRLLMIRRAAHLKAGGKVCFPGGAVEIGEAPPDAAVREIKEELGIDIHPIACVWEFVSSTAPLRLLGFTADWVAGEIHADPGEIAEIFWLTPEEGSTHADGLPTNREFIQAIVAAVTT